jgi:hypothetical protein
MFAFFKFILADFDIQSKIGCFGSEFPHVDGEKQSFLRRRIIKSCDVKDADSILPPAGQQSLGAVRSVRISRSADIVKMNEGSSSEPPAWGFESRAPGQTQRSWPDPVRRLRDRSGHQPVDDLR